MDNIICILNVFYLASGLKLISTSRIYMVCSFKVARMAAGTSFSSSSLPFSYLGLPIGSNMGRIENWKVLIDHFKARLPGWKANLLSSGGRLTLIKSVLGSLGIYYLSIFKSLEGVTKVLKCLHALFFGGASVEKKKLVWIKWSNILASLDKGGLVKVVKLVHGDEAGIELKGSRCLFDSLLERHLALRRAPLLSL
ncbi:hypothetical protein Tco_1423636 [Tanacetum coccineum]